MAKRKRERGPADEGPRREVGGQQAQEVHAAPVPGPEAAGAVRRRSLPAVVAAVLVLAVAAGACLSAWLLPRWRDGELASATLEQLSQRAQAQPNDPLVCYYYGRALLQQNQPAQAEGMFQRAVSLDAHLGRAYLGLARSAVMLGRLAEAERAFHDATVQDPGNMEAQVLLARLYYDNGRPKEALGVLEAAAKLRPDSAELWQVLAHVYGDLGKRDLALTAMEKCTQLQPQVAEYWRDLGRVYWHYLRKADSVRALQRAVQLRSNDPVTHLWLAQALLQGTPNEEDRRQAEASIRRALELRPHFPEAALELGRLLPRTGSAMEAEKWLRLAAKEAPVNQQAQFQLGQFLRATGRAKEAASYLAAASRLADQKRDVQRLEAEISASPRSPELRLRLARLYRKNQNIPAAVGEYDRYLSMKPTDRAVAKELQACRAELASPLQPGNGGGATRMP